MNTRSQDIIIGIPCFNEEDSIRKTAEAVDAGLVPYREKEYLTLILALDSDSTDSTRSVFLDTQLHSPKRYINTGASPRGKGRNLLALLDEGVREKARCIATIDADIQTIAPSWIPTLIEPIMSGDTDYVAPLYRRNRFEGSTTNHFAFPLVYAYFGRAVRQPIGGECAMTSTVAEYLLEQRTTGEIEAYGIDVFMTVHALGYGFRIAQAFLGQKLHKPSFPKIVGMFEQVAATAFVAISDYRCNRSVAENLHASASTSGIDTFAHFPHKEKAVALLATTRPIFDKHRAMYQRLFPDSFPLCANIMREVGSSMDEHLWTDILSSFIRSALKEDDAGKRALAHLLMPIFLKRAVSFWLAAEAYCAEETERRLVRGAELLREKITID